MEDTTVLVRALLREPHRQRAAAPLPLHPARGQHHPRASTAAGSSATSPDVARFCTEQWAGDADIIRCVHWYEQRHKYHLVFARRHHPRSVPGALARRLRHAGDTRQPHDPRLRAAGLPGPDHGFTLPLRIKQRLAKMRRRDG